MVAVVLLPIVIGAYTLSRPAGARARWWALTAVASFTWLALGAASGTSSDDAKVDVLAESVTATTERRQPTTTTERTSHTTVPRSPEGARRSGTGADAADAPADVDAEQLERAPATNDLLESLASLTLEPEHDRSSYDRELFDHWDDEDHDGCDTRCEVLSAQRRPDGTWLSEWDGYNTDDPGELHVDHVVALAEAWDSGADRWTAAQRDAFADHLPNLLAVSASSNLRKSDKDAAEWFPSRAEANCLWASTVVRVKAQWDLTVDRAESDALGNLLRTCEDYTPPTTTTVRPTTTTMTTAAPPPPPPPTSSCTPGYSPCIAPGDDVDCAGGQGNGPRYIEGPVYVDHAHGDPYGLDADGDGIGCDA